MMGLSDGRKSFPIGLAVLIQYRSVTASHPASHVAVAITLNAKASSLKMMCVFNFLVPSLLLNLLLAYMQIAAMEMT